MKIVVVLFTCFQFSNVSANELSNLRAHILTNTLPGQPLPEMSLRECQDRALSVATRLEVALEKENHAKILKAVSKLESLVLESPPICSNVDESVRHLIRFALDQDRELLRDL